MSGPCKETTFNSLIHKFSSGYLVLYNRYRCFFFPFSAPDVDSLLLRCLFFLLTNWQYFKSTISWLLKMEGLSRILMVYSCLSVCQPACSTSSFSPTRRALYQCKWVFFLNVHVLVCLHHAGPVDVSIQAKCDPCLSSPCKNDGTCSNDPVHYYRCSCPYGFKVHTHTHTHTHTHAHIHTCTNTHTHTDTHTHLHVESQNGLTNTLRSLS